MARENSSGLNVSTRYGVVNIPDGARGELGRGEGGIFTLAADFSADLINSDSIGQAVTVLYPGTLVLRGWAEVETAVSLSGAGAAVSIGRQGGLGTDSADLSGSAVVVGFKALGLKGTFSTGITATTTVVVAMAAGSIEGGAGRLILEVLKA
jgi:hypothetical protein